MNAAYLVSFPLVGNLFKEKIQRPINGKKDSRLGESLR